MKKTLARIAFAFATLTAGAGNMALAADAARQTTPATASAEAPATISAEAPATAPANPAAGSPAAPAPGMPWLYIVGGVIVIGAGVLVYRMASNKDTPANPPAQRSSQATPRAPAAVPTTPAAVVHDNFDAKDFLRQAKASFLRLQAAWDKADVNDLAKFTTPQILAELKAQIGDRGPDANRTEVIEITAELLGVEPISSDYVASVQFKGSIKPAGATAAEPFTEVWNMTRAIQATTGWKLSGIKQLSS